MTEKMTVTFYGPNLTRAGQDKGQFHVHRAGCGHDRFYGEGSKYGGAFPWTEDVTSVLDAVEAVYCDIIAENPDDQVEDYLAEFWFAPCTSALPRGEER